MPFPNKKPAKKGDAPAKKKNKKKPVLFKAPEDFKPAFYEIGFDTMKDGLINGGSIHSNRVKGAWDNEDAKRFNLQEYDLPTLLAISNRLGCVSFAPNIAKRLPPKMRFFMVIRAGKRGADGTLVTTLKGVRYLGENKAGKPKWFWLSNESEGENLKTYRKIRRLKTILASAFVEAQLPPSGRKTKKKKKDEEDDE